LEKNYGDNENETEIDETITELEWARRHVPRDPFMAERKTEIIGCGVSVRRHRKRSRHPELPEPCETTGCNPDIRHGPGTAWDTMRVESRFESIERHLGDLESTIANIVASTIRTCPVPRERKVHRYPGLRRIFWHRNIRCTDCLVKGGGL
jgi:hypothetical protein